MRVRVCVDTRAQVNCSTVPFRGQRSKSRFLGSCHGTPFLPSALHTSSADAPPLVLAFSSLGFLALAGRFTSISSLTKPFTPTGCTPSRSCGYLSKDTESICPQTFPQGLLTAFNFSARIIASAITNWYLQILFLLYPLQSCLTNKESILKTYLLLKAILAESSAQRFRLSMTSIFFLYLLKCDNEYCFFLNFLWAYS